VVIKKHHLNLIIIIDIDIVIDNYTESSGTSVSVGEHNQVNFCFPCFIGILYLIYIYFLIISLCML